MSTNSSIFDWLKVPRDSETIGRSLQRKVFGLDNKSSYPLLSGDTFKYMCNVILEGQLNENELNLSTLQALRGKIFAQAEPMSNATRILVSACKSGFRFPGANLIIHNGDVVPNVEEMQILGNSFNQIYSVNWLGDASVALPLPIGLENRDKRRNGVPGDYLRENEKGLPTHDQRDISLLAAFSVHTNFRERLVALDYARQIPGVKIVTDPITPKQYRKLVLRAKFVLSPPGNGPDCHRTWEALYLGATPIVHSSSWPFLGYEIPALVVDSWTEIGGKIKSHPLSINDSWKKIHRWIAS